MHLNAFTRSIERLPPGSCCQGHFLILLIVWFAHVAYFRTLCRHQKKGKTYLQETVLVAFWWLFINFTVAIRNTHWPLTWNFFEVTFASLRNIPVNKLLLIASYKDFERCTEDFQTSLEGILSMHMDFLPSTFWEICKYIKFNNLFKL